MVNRFKESNQRALQSGGPSRKDLEVANLVMGLSKVQRSSDTKFGTQSSRGDGSLKYPCYS